MKLIYLSRFPLLAGLMALWLALRRAGRDRSAGCGIRPAQRELTPREMTIARNARQYFVANFQPTTGLVNAVNKYPPPPCGTAPPIWPR